MLTGWLALVIALAAPTPVGADRHRGDDHPGAGTLLLGAAGEGVEALRLDTRLALDVRGLLGELTLTQTFRNTSGRWLDGTYLFPLPEDAAVRALELRVGERRIVGQVLAREDATARFEAARDAGQVAGLVEQQRPNLFTASLSSVPPNGEIRVVLEILLPVRASDERLSLTIPTTLTPRYINAHAAGADALDGPILPASTIDGPRFSLSATLAPLDDLSLASSPSHRLTIEGDRLVVQEAPMDRDLHIVWPFADGERQTERAFSASHLDERYVQLFLTPPAALANDDTAAARELVLVIDTSGSMAGTSMAAARAAAQSALDGLRAIDSLDLIAFDDRTRSLFDGPRPATTTNLAAARRFVRRLAADGGTEMAPALQRAFGPATERNGETGDVVANRLRQIVFLTDGSIADEDRLLQSIRRGTDKDRLFTVGIGAAPNTWFLEKAAELGRGSALTIRDVDDVQNAVTALLGRLERPVLTDIEVQFPGGGAETYPARVPDLYADGPLMVVARLEGDAAAADREAIVTGWRGEERFMRRIALPSPTAARSLTEANSTTDEADVPAAPALAMHWARAKVATLMDEQRASRDTERHRDAIVALALDVGLVTPWTSFVAVEAPPVRPANAARGNAEVANLLPQGNEMTSFTLPRGAAGIDTFGILGVLAGMLGSAMLWIAQSLGRHAPGSSNARRIARSPDVVRVS